MKYLILSAYLIVMSSCEKSTERVERVSLVEDTLSKIDTEVLQKDAPVQEENFQKGSENVRSGQSIEKEDRKEVKQDDFIKKEDKAQEQKEIELVGNLERKDLDQKEKSGVIPYQIMSRFLPGPHSQRRDIFEEFDDEKNQTVFGETERKEIQGLLEKMIGSWEDFVRDQRIKGKNLDRKQSLQEYINALQEKLVASYESLGTAIEQQVEERYKKAVEVLSDFDELKDWLLTRSNEKKYEDLQEKYPTEVILIKVLEDAINLVVKN